MPQSAEHKAKIASAVREYHACARSKGCGKGVKKKVDAVKKKAMKFSKAKKTELDKKKAQAKARLQKRLKEHANPLKKVNLNLHQIHR